MPQVRRGGVFNLFNNGHLEFIIDFVIPSPNDLSML